MRRRDFLALASLAPAIRPALAHSRIRQSRQQIDDISALIASKMSEYHVPGVAFGLHLDNQTTRLGFGVTSVDDPQPVTQDTIFTIASISKTFTATAMMKLVDQGKLSLDAPVQKYLPDFRVQDETASRDVTIAHLLTHTPGWEGQLSTEDRGLEALAHFATTIMRDLPQLAAPGAVWSYNNAGFSLAGRVIEVVSGRNIHDALRELVFAPLGLSRTFTRLPDAITYRMSLGHREQAGKTQVLRPFQTTSGTTAGGVMTSITDLMRYARFHLTADAEANGKLWLGPNALASMRTPRLQKNSTDDEMGIGWHLRRLDGVQTAAHGGTLNGHCLLVELVPSRNLAFAILTNHTDGWRLIQDVEQAVLREFAGIGLAPNQRIGHRGVNEAMSFHSKPLTTQPPLDEYVGSYVHPPLGGMQVRKTDNGLVVSQGNSSNGTTITFYGKDAAYATAGSYVGSPFEFVRTPAGAVGWIRVNGRIARRDPPA